MKLHNFNKARSERACAGASSPSHGASWVEAADYDKAIEFHIGVQRRMSERIEELKAENATLKKKYEWAENARKHLAGACQLCKDKKLADEHYRELMAEAIQELKEARDDSTKYGEETVVLTEQLAKLRVSRDKLAEFVAQDGEWAKRYNKIKQDKQTIIREATSKKAEAIKSWIKWSENEA